MIDTVQLTRECGTCSLCCKVYDVPVLDKQAGAWCTHFSQGSGCTIHAQRPNFCKSFFCNWIYQKELGPEWKPDRSRFVLTTDPNTKNILVEVDPGLPTAWKREPYYSAMKFWAKNLLQQQRHIAVSVKKFITILLPNEDVSIGILKPGEKIFFSQKIMSDLSVKVFVKVNSTTINPIN